MNNSTNTLSSLEQICRQQYEEIEKKKLQIWDVEEENRLLRICNQRLTEDEEKHLGRIDELERWCTHLQRLLDAEVEKREKRERQYAQLEKRFGVLFRIACKIKKMLVD